MPSGVKDWLAGKTTALAKKRHNSKDKRKANADNSEGGRCLTTGNRTSDRKMGLSLKDGEAKTKDQKRRDQQLALDRRAAAGAAADATITAMSSEPLPPGVAEKKKEDLTQCFEAGSEFADDKAGAADQARRAGGAQPVAAGEAWLELMDPHHSNRGLGFDSIELAAEPKSVVLQAGDGGGGAHQQAPSWSFANSGVAAMADGEEWELLEDELGDDEKDARLDGEWMVSRA